MIKTELAEKIRILRKQKGLRQDDLAGKAGVSIRVIKDLESASGNPTIESLNLIVSVLGVSLSQILMSGMELTNPDIIQAPRAIGSNSADKENKDANTGVSIGTISQPCPDTQGHKDSSSKSRNPPHKMSKEIDKVNHSHSSDQNTKNFSPDRASLILEIQDLLKELPQNELEMLKKSAENLKTISKSKNQKSVF